MTKLELETVENNDALRSFTLSRKLADGTVQPVDLTNASVEFYLKANADQADADAIALYSTGGGAITITDAAAGKLDVQFVAANVSVPGKYAYHLDVIKNGRRVTYAFGLLRVINV